MPTRTALRLVPSPAQTGSAQEPEDDRYLTVPVPRGSGAGRGLPWDGDAEVAWVPAVLLLAASGKCSCDDCCAALVRQQRRGSLSAV